MSKQNATLPNLSTSSSSLSYEFPFLEWQNHEIALNTDVLRVFTDGIILTNWLYVNSNEMNYSSVITKLYFLLIHADGKINEREISLGQQMVSSEAIDAEEFKVQMVLLKSKDHSKIYSDGLMGLKKLERDKQIRIVAWLCVVANADGFMDRTEWQFIYKIYHTELHLPLDEIMNKQKELNRIQHSPFFSDPQTQVAFSS